jgi:hypothetical protein
LFTLDTGQALAPGLNVKKEILPRGIKMPAPKKSFKSANYEVAVWENERDYEQGIVSFQTVSLKKSWKDKTNVTREQYISLRKQDVERVLVLLRKAQEYLVLGEKENE